MEGCCMSSGDRTELGSHRIDEGLIDGGDAKKVPILALLFAAQAVGGKQLLIAGITSRMSE